MKKFERLPPRQRKEEIMAAALQVFNEKGFSAATMENIVSRVTLSKGGVYRIYPSTDAILEDLILAGMHLRNDYYDQRMEQETAAGRRPDLRGLMGIILDSLVLYPDFSGLYVEFLWEKRRNPRLEALYQSICAKTVEETRSLISKCGAEDLLLSDEKTLRNLTELMNCAILGIRVLGLETNFKNKREALLDAMLRILQA